jgi:hypothetical protein
MLGMSPECCSDEAGLAQVYGVQCNSLWWAYVCSFRIQVLTVLRGFMCPGFDGWTGYLCPAAWGFW